MKDYLSVCLLLFCFFNNGCSQNYSFNFTNSGKRVCLVEAKADTSKWTIKVILLDSAQNTQYPTYIYRRASGSNTWQLAASGIAAGTGHWIDKNVKKGEVWEYQIRRKNTWSYENTSYDAIGYAIGSLLFDNADYKGQMILLVADDIPKNLSAKYTRLKKELTADGWYVKELTVKRAANWDSGDDVVEIRKQVADIYNAAPANDKPKCLYILGHVPLPRSGDGTLLPSDGHEEHMGARGCDAYYADINGVYTDVKTFKQANLGSPLFENLPGDYKWDQETFPSDIEMAFGRVDFADLEYSLTEMKMMENYLDRVSNYRNVAAGYNMGDKCAYFEGYENSVDATFRNLPAISGSKNLIENTKGTPHPQWVKNNGPFKVYMQNTSTPEITEWGTYGMNAAVFTSDQSNWGYGDIPQNAPIRSLMGVNSKCMVVIWTTAATNVFHQAGAGIPLGVAMKTIMNHNKTNNYLEKPQQFYDHQYYWARTHFSFYGDPLINLYQISPPSGLSITNANGHAQLQWSASPDNTIKGYHVYESTGEYGKFVRVTSAPVKVTNYNLPSYTKGHWYMVKAVKVITSGSGMFLHSSLGISVQGNLDITGIGEANEVSSTIVGPNPARSILNIQAEKSISNIQFYDTEGKLVLTEHNAPSTGTTVDISLLADKLYICKVTYKDGSRSIHKIIKQ